MTQQEELEPLSHPALVTDGILAGANQVADGFIRRLGNRNRYQLSCTMQAWQAVTCRDDPS